MANNKTFSKSVYAAFLGKTAAIPGLEILPTRLLLKNRFRSQGTGARKSSHSHFAWSQSLWLALGAIQLLPKTK